MTGDQTWGASPDTPQRWGRRETFAAIVVAALIGLLGGGAIYAATDSAPHPGPAPAGFGAPGHSMGRVRP